MSRVFKLVAISAIIILSVGGTQVNSQQATAEEVDYKVTEVNLTNDSVAIEQGDEIKVYNVSTGSSSVADHKAVILNKNFDNWSGELNLSESVKNNYSTVHTKGESIVLYNSSNTTTVRSRNTTVITADGKGQFYANYSKNVANFLEMNQEKVYVYMVPEIEYRYLGFMSSKTGENVVWVETDIRVNATLLHEFVHVHQDYIPSENLEWFDEGSAAYIEERLLNKLHGGEVYQDMDSYWFDKPENESAPLIHSIELRDPSTYNGAEYTRGRNVVYLIDVSLRHHTNGSTNIVDLMQYMNSHNGTVTYSEFKSYIINKTDARFGERLDSYVGSRPRIDIYDEHIAITGRYPYEDPEEHEELPPSAAGL